jgi:exodeoxyribonuclease VII large subunit
MHDRRRNAEDDRPGEALSVSEVTARVKQVIETGFADVWVAGEVSNLVRASSGHLYLSLKDDGAILKAVVWRGTVPTLAIEPADGLEVICHGRLEVYPPRGSYQLTIDRLHAVGTGTLEARLRKLHAALELEGVFLPERKRPLPAFPRRVAVVTSPSGAAVADFLEAFRSRWRGCELLVVPSRVQGAGAAEELAAALALVARIVPAVDVVALVRGGGSLEDLWSFNEEVLVRAVAASPIPIVSGVGHEIDVSLCDLAADVRALTPTDAAIRIAPDQAQVTAALAGFAARLQSGLARRAEMARERLGQFARSRILADPTRLVTERRSLVAERAARLERLARAAVDRAGERLRAGVARLDAGSPLKLLARGYSVTTSAGTTAPLTSIATLAAGTTIVTQLADGRLTSTVTSIDSTPIATQERIAHHASPQ